MPAKKFVYFKNVIEKYLPVAPAEGISYADFDRFIDSVLSVSELDLVDHVYCRDGFAHVAELDYDTYQIAVFQINTFGKGAFGDAIRKLCTPILLTVKTHGSHRQAEHSLADTGISIDDFYLGENYCGSMGEKCDRKTILDHTRKVFMSHPGIVSYNHQLIYELINTNYICHHVAEVMGYAFSALNNYWAVKQHNHYMVSASIYSDNLHKLMVEITEDFSGDRMRNYFEVPHYIKLMENLEKFSEEFGQMLWEVDFKHDIESFYLPVGFQKTGGKRYKKNINIITSQHILDHILKTYYRRRNSHLVSNTYQTLEFLSRAIIAKMEGKDNAGKDFLKSVSTCMGHYPDRAFNDILEKMKNKYHVFESDFAHSNFFRPPVL